jgi:hypothetical protein
VVSHYVSEFSRLPRQRARELFRVSTRAAVIDPAVRPGAASARSLLRVTGRRVEGASLARLPVRPTGAAALFRSLSTNGIASVNLPRSGRVIAWACCHIVTFQW